ncbi:MAG TPA: S41 family peptidase [Vicinamibacterales bacterium]|nr:S41 family peptidase [Vicinamibacterales bacterium]
MNGRLLLAGVLVASGAVLDAQPTRALETFDKAWTIIRDTHFDVTMNGVDWEAVRTELRPRAAEAGTDSELRAVIREMLGKLGQSHFALIPSTADASTGGRLDLSAGPGFDFRLVGNVLLVTRVVAGGPASDAGVRPGWTLTAIGSTDAARLLSTIPQDVPARIRNVEVWRAVETHLRGSSGTQIELTFQDGDSRNVAVKLEREPDAGEPARVGNLPTMAVRVESESRKTPNGKSAGIIAFNVWMPSVDGRFQAAVDRLRSADGMVLDLRGNPGGLAAMLMGISGHFLTERKVLGTMKTRETQLRFTANPRQVSAAGERVAPFGGPVAILVDSLTGSASECFAGGMQSIGRARVFGQSSMGQALPAVFDRLPNGDTLIHAYGDFVTADGTRLEGRGVVPDEEVPLTRQDLLAGRDATLERALHWIDRVVSPASPSGGQAP